MQHSTPPAEREAGIATLEFALVLPILLVLVWAAISYGMVFTVNHTLSAAAAEGARAAVGAPTEADAITAAAAAASDQLGALGQHATNAQVAAPAVGDCVAPADTRCITVQVAYPWASAPVIPELFGVLMPDLLEASSTIQLSEGTAR